MRLPNRTATEGRDDARAVELRCLLGRFELLRFDAVVDVDGAATIYRPCRRRGVTPRGPLDCTIVAVAAQRGASLLAQDADLRRGAEVIDLPLGGG